jgi:hypothetical protein
VYDKVKVLQAFKRLRCVQFAREEDRWLWLFQYEAKKLTFATPYSKIPTHRRPIVIGSFRFPHDAVMWLDVRSHARASHSTQRGAECEFRMTRTSVMATMMRRVPC